MASLLALRVLALRVLALRVAAAACLLSTSACLYHFSGGGLPSHVKTMAVVPFENQTAVADVQREISDSLRSRLTERLGLRTASVGKADAIVRGVIRQYQADVPVGYSANTNAPTTARRQLQILLDIDVVDQVTGKSLFSKKGYVVTGEYDEQQEARGRSQAIDRIVTAIVEGVQSQW
jgi:hypothetical protein